MWSAKGLYELLSCFKYSSDIWHLNLWKALLLTVLMVSTQNLFWNYYPLVYISWCTCFPYQMTMCVTINTGYLQPLFLYLSIGQLKGMNLCMLKWFFWIVESAPIRIKLILFSKWRENDIIWRRNNPMIWLKSIKLTRLKNIVQISDGLSWSIVTL